MPRCSSPTPATSSRTCSDGSTNTTSDALGELLDLLAERGIRLVFARLKGTVRDRLEPYGLVTRIGREHFYPTTGEAVQGYVRETGVEWHDWSDDKAENSDAPES